MNNGGSQSGSPTTSDAGQTSGAPTSWVSKTARHRQLINSSVYERENQNRAKAIETTRRQQLADRNARETAKLSNHFQRQMGGGASVRSGSSDSPSIGHHEIELNGIRFRVVQNGSKLVKLPGGLLSTRSGTLNTTHFPLGDVHSPSETPKVATIGGVKFHRSRNGNLYRHGILKAQRYVWSCIVGNVLTRMDEEQSNNRHQEGVRTVPNVFVDWYFLLALPSTQPKAAIYVFFSPSFAFLLSFPLPLDPRPEPDLAGFCPAKLGNW